MSPCMYSETNHWLHHLVEELEDRQAELCAQVEAASSAQSASAQHNARMDELLEEHALEHSRLPMLEKEIIMLDINHAEMQLSELRQDVGQLEGDA